MGGRGGGQGVCALGGGGQGVCALGGGGQGVCALGGVGRVCAPWGGGHQQRWVAGRVECVHVGGAIS